MDRAVGITQLQVPGIQGHPNLSGLKRTWVSVIRNFQRQSQFDSLPFESSSHFSPHLACKGITPLLTSAIIAKGDRPEPSPSSPAKAGQLPLEFWMP